MKDVFSYNIAKEIIKLRLQGKQQLEISELTKVSQTTISYVLRYYSYGEYHRYLGRNKKNIIDRILSEEKNGINMIEYPTYECRILFGLITLKFKPVSK